MRLSLKSSTKARKKNLKSQVPFVEGEFWKSKMKKGGGGVLCKVLAAEADDIRAVEERLRRGEWERAGSFGTNSGSVNRKSSNKY